MKHKKTKIKQLLTTNELKEDYSWFLKLKFSLFTTILIASMILIISTVLLIIYGNSSAGYIELMCCIIDILAILIGSLLEKLIFNEKNYSSIKNVLAFLYAKTNLKRFKRWFKFIFFKAHPHLYKKHRNEWLELVDKCKGEELIEKIE